MCFITYIYIEPYMVINENFIYVPGWDERNPPNDNNNKNNNIWYIYKYPNNIY